MSAKSATSRTKASRDAKAKASGKGRPPDKRTAKKESAAKRVKPAAGRDPKQKQAAAPALARATPAAKKAAAPIARRKKAAAPVVKKAVAPAAKKAAAPVVKKAVAPAAKKTPEKREVVRKQDAKRAQPRPAKVASKDSGKHAAKLATPSSLKEGRSSKDGMMKMTQDSTGQTAPAKDRGVLRIAEGARKPKTEAEPVEATLEERPRAAAARVSTIRRPGPQSMAQSGAVAPSRPGAVQKGAALGPKIEINPRLESTRGLLKNPESQARKERPMSVAQKNRAIAEAAFLRVAGGPVASSTEETSAMPPSPPPMPPHGSNGTSHGAASGPGAVHKSQFEMRISERDSLTTTLRLAESRDVALGAARELARRFKLPPDQALLTKVIALGEAGLTKLALEELLELDDRGRVRRTPELRDTLDHLRSEDRETVELKELLLEKMGAFGA